MAASTSAMHRRSDEPSLPRHATSRAAGAAVLPLRLVAFAGVQAAIAIAHAVGGRSDAWAASVPWWPLVATTVNILTIAVVARLLHREGRRYRDLFRVAREHVGRDLATVVALGLPIGVVAVLPNLLLSTWLFGDPEAPLATLVQPLPTWAAWAALVAFPVTIALSELPAYFGYAQPRLTAATGRPWLAVALTSAFLSLQHATLPLVLDATFVLWRSLMFLPFAVLLGVVLRWRPRLLPYLVVLHGLADAQVAWLILDASG